jgi:hypothetical protein
MRCPRRAAVLACSVLAAEVAAVVEVEPCRAISHVVVDVEVRASYRR